MKTTHHFTRFPLILLFVLAGCVTNDVPSATGDMQMKDQDIQEDMPSDMSRDDMFDQEASPKDMSDMPADMPVSDLGDSGQDMPDLAPLDMGLDMPVDMTLPEPCDGLCTPGEELCVEGSCVNVCQMQQAECGEVSVEGDFFTCGSCSEPQEACIANTCKDLCAESMSQCGELEWSGQQVECGLCTNLDDLCSGQVCHSGAAGWRSVTTGRAHSCGLKSDGKVWCWGSNLEGQVGRPVAGDGSQVPLETVNLGTVASISAKDQHTCAVDLMGFAWCWGDNSFGQIGNGQTVTRTTPYRITTLQNVRAVDAATWHTCALLDNGEVRCVGYGRQGQIGDGTTSNSTSYRAVHLSESDAFAMAVGTAHTCAILRGGQTQCWGFNGQEQSYGRLGAGDTASRSAPVNVSQSGEAFHQISAGEKHTCAVSQQHEVWCWGDNTFGQLGDGTSLDSLVPRKVMNVSDIRHVYAGKEHTCAVSHTGGLFCWGRNDDGQLGLGNLNVQRTPQPVALSDVLEVAPGFYHTCAVTSEGRLFCWGRNDSGQLGIHSLTSSTTPVEVVD